MKQVLLSMVMMAAGAVMPVAAETVEFDFSTGYENSQLMIQDIVKDGVTLKMSGNGGSKDPAWYSSGAALRLYGGNSMNGVRVQGDKLRSGVYLVRYADGKVEKVLVKQTAI